MILALSTSWISNTLSNPQDVVDTLDETGINTVELDYRLNADAFHRLRAVLKQNSLRVASLHNYCPVPVTKPQKWPSGDYFSLSSLDEEERKLALDYTGRTIEHACDLEAFVVVLHCGAVGMPVDMGKIRRLHAAGSDGAKDLSARIIGDLQQRRLLIEPYLDALLFSLDKLVSRATRCNVRLGLENRFHYHELPSHTDLDRIWKEFAGGPVGYWHDTGHAHAQEKLGIISQKELIEAHACQLVGIHLHDAIGLEDHLPPGHGEIDFGFLEPFLSRNIPLVMELAPGTAADHVRAGAASAKKMARGCRSPQSHDFSLDLPKNIL